MGDRIAVLKEGGQLAQYATPAELLMAPADDFVEDFVGADRALKRLALLRVADIDLWEAPLAFVGQATAEVRAKLEGAEVPHALRRRRRAPPARLALRVRPRSATTVPARPDASPDPILEREDVLRDALSDLLQAETQLRARGRRARRDRGRALGRDHLRVPDLPGRAGRGAPGRRAPAGRTDARALATAAPARPGRRRLRPRPRRGATSCVAKNDTVCVDWAIDNIDRYVTPTLEHLVLVVVLGRGRVS